jgi:hypothetical protein
MAVKRLRERLALLGGTALLALAIFGAIARRTLARGRPAGHDAPEPPPAGTVPP